MTLMVLVLMLSERGSKDGDADDAKRNWSDVDMAVGENLNNDHEDFVGDCNNSCEDNVDGDT